MTSKSVGISIDPELMASHYRSKVAELGLAQAVQVTMAECGISEDDATALLEGRKNIVSKKGKYSLIDVRPFWTFDDGFENFDIGDQADVSNWYAKAKAAFEQLCSKFAEKDLCVLRCREIEVQKFLIAFQHVRDQILGLKYECPELIEGVRYSRIVGAES